MYRKPQAHTRRINLRVCHVIVGHFHGVKNKKSGGRRHALRAGAMFKRVEIIKRDIIVAKYPFGDAASIYVLMNSGH